MEDSNKDRCIQVGNIYPDSENMANRSGGRVYSTTGCAPTILSRDFKQPKMIMEEVKIGAMRWRNPDNPSERGKSNGNYQQRLEVNENGTSNIITSVQKDNLVCEPIIYDDYNRRIPKNQDYIGTITTNIGSPTPRNGYKLIIPEATAKGYAEATDGDSVNLEQPNSKTRRGRVGKQMANTLTTSCNQGVVVSEPKAVSYTRDSKGKTQNKHLNEIVNTIHSSTGSGGNTDCFVAEPQVQQIDNQVVEPLNPYKDGTCRTIKAQYQQRSRANFTRQDGLGATGVVQNRYRIRKLTPRECFRLMDVDENVIDTIQAAGISNSQQYKLAGNSIVVACLEKIFEQMFFPQYTNSRTLFG